MAEQQAAFLQVLHQRLVGALEELAADQAATLEVPVRADGCQKAAFRREQSSRKRGGLVRPVPSGGDSRRHHEVRGAGELDELEGPLVGPALHVAAAHRGLDGPALAEGGLEQRRGDHQGLLAVAGHHVVHVGVRGDRGVRHQRPGGGGPHEQARPAGVRAGGQGHPDVDRRVGDGLVALGELVVGQSCAAAGAVGGDPVVLHQQSFRVDLLQRPHTDWT
jgi:hypothetical protein